MKRMTFFVASALILALINLTPTALAAVGELEPRLDTGTGPTFPQPEDIIDLDESYILVEYGSCLEESPYYRCRGVGKGMKCIIPIAPETQEKPRIEGKPQRRQYILLASSTPLCDENMLRMIAEVNPNDNISYDGHGGIAMDIEAGFRNNQVASAGEGSVPPWGCNDVLINRPIVVDEDGPKEVIICTSTGVMEEVRLTIHE